MGLHFNTRSAGGCGLGAGVVVVVVGFVVAVVVVVVVFVVVVTDDDEVSALSEISASELL